MATPEMQALLANLRPRSQASASRTQSREPSTSINPANRVSTASPAPFSPTSIVPPAPNAINSAFAQNLLSLLNSKGPAATPAATNQSSGSPTIPAARDVVPSIEEEDTAIETPISQPVQTAPISEPQPPAAASGSIFTYKNPFEALKASRANTPQPSQSAQSSAPTEVVPQSLHVEQPESLTTSIVSDPGITAEDIPTRVILTPKSRLSRGPGSETPQPETPPQQDPIVDHTLLNSNGNQSAETAKEAELVVPDRVVPVLTFPNKAFVSITVIPGRLPVSQIRDAGVIEISRLKKDFDQIDRSLVSASSKYITYTFSKNGGMRIIRQDDGSGQHVFKGTDDRVFNIALCTSNVNAESTSDQAVLGTGVSGAVYYAAISKDGVDYFAEDKLETESMIIPAHPQVDDQTVGGLLKTRAKRSSRHPEFFAVGRGKTINIIWPAMVMSPQYGISGSSREVDVEKLYRERSLQIVTGKAGKDFAFSEDDSVIVSLDKAGKLRFWDVRKLVDHENGAAVQVTPYRIDSPLLSLSTVSSAEKCWPTSVLLLDKSRPYAKGGALRYVLVGLRQNHTIQLWDIALGKAVQEINFPHENDDDAICSIAYHAASGIIALGHPTRNSIFFIHLSVPRYTLSSTLSQASYIQRIAAKDSTVPAPSNTACMSGVREIKFGERGQIRSLDLLPVLKASTSSSTGSVEEILFELYVAHSRGITCLQINRSDLGWSEENKVINPIDAESNGFVTLSELSLGSVADEELPQARSPEPEVVQTAASKNGKKKSKKNKEVLDTLADDLQDLANGQLEFKDTRVQDNASEPIDVVTTKDSKKSKKKLVQPEQPLTNGTHRAEVEAPAAQASAPTASTKIPTNSTKPESMSMSISGDWLDKELSKVEKRVAGEFRKELDVLKHDLKKDRAAQDQASADRQAALLRVVSETLTKNVESSIARILESQLASVVIPAVVQSVTGNLTSALSDSMDIRMPALLQAHIPKHIESSLQSPTFLQAVSDKIVSSMTSQLQNAVSTTIESTIVAHLNNVATASAAKAVDASVDKHAHHMQQLQAQQVESQAKSLEQMKSLQQTLTSMTATLQALSESHAVLQQQMLTMREATREMAQSNVIDQEPPRGRSISSRPASVVQETKVDTEDPELTEIRQMMTEERYEEGSIKWLQSAQPGRLFDELFVHFTPDYLATDLSPLVAFSVGITVANSLPANAERRVEWIAAAFDAVDFQDPEITALGGHGPQLLDTMAAKLNSTMRLVPDHDQVLRNQVTSLAERASMQAQHLRKMTVE